MNITIIVSPCVKQADGSWMSRAGEATRFQYVNFLTLPEVFNIGKTFIMAGKCVIVRPNYNETDEEGKRYFREWRSFDGGGFEEVRFYVG